jgi:hypothetical protein
MRKKRISIKRKSKEICWHSLDVIYCYFEMSCFVDHLCLLVASRPKQQTKQLNKSILSRKQCFSQLKMVSIIIDASCFKVATLELDHTDLECLWVFISLNWPSAK